MHRAFVGAAPSWRVQDARLPSKSQRFIPERACAAFNSRPVW